MTVINGVILKDRYAVIPKSLKTGNNTTPCKAYGNQKTKLIACKSIYCTNINDGIKKHIQIARNVLIFSKQNQKKR